MDNTTTMYIVIGLLTIFFIVLLIFSAKTWRILHMLSAFFVFVAAGFLVWFAAATLKTTSEWRRAVTVLTEKVALEEEKAQTLLDGTPRETRPAIPGSPFEEFEYHPDGIRDVRAALERTLLDRGRVWRKCTAVVNNPGAAVPSITLTIPATAAAPPAGGEDPPAEAPPEDDPTDPADPVEPAPAPAGAHAIAVNTIVYGFAEGESELEGELRVTGFTVPRVYLGEFRVLERTNSTITLQPTIPLTPLQLGNLETSTWTVYDNMPIDRHNAFAGLSEEDLRLLFPRGNLSMSTAQYREEIARLATFFDGVSADQLSAKVPMASVVMNDAQYDALLQSYLRDGQEANTDNDPADRVWYLVQFNAPTSIQVDAFSTTAEGDPQTANYVRRAAIARKSGDGEVLIVEQSVDQLLSRIPDQPQGEILGNFALGITVADKLKQVSDATIDELWEVKPTIPWDPENPPKLKNLDALAPPDLKAVLPTALEKKSIEFDLGDTTLVDSRTAEFLTERIDPETGMKAEFQIADKVESVYVRQLRDYATYFNDDYRFDLQFEDEARVIKQDTTTLVAANAKALEQVNYRADEIGKLQIDREGFQREVAAITEVLATMDGRNKALRADLSKLYTYNLQLAARIRAMQTQMANAIRRADQGAREPGAADLLPDTVSAP